jgi:Carboxypeptidase regulatory-like domain
MNLSSKLLVTCLGFILSALIAAGCGTEKPLGTSPITTGALPEMPAPVLGKAIVSGRVLDADGNGVMSATVKVAETDGSTTTDATGAFMMMVPSDSTLTIATSAAGFATSFRESIMLASQAAVSGFDVMLLRTADVSRINALGVPDQAATRGLMAIRLHSTNPTCATAGAHVTVWPPLAAKVVYGQPSTGGGLDQPDPTLGSVQTGGHIDAWLVGAIPPGNMLQIGVDQAGCTLMTQGPSVDGMIFTGQRRVDVQSLTEADLFLE